ncbi:twin-arginine translocation signal domain-containing protein [Pectinatus frisingensis]
MGISRRGFMKLAGAAAVCSFERGR